jgi:hypothetical protein
MTADVLLDDIVERSTRRYLVTGVLNMWEVSMGGSHNVFITTFPFSFFASSRLKYNAEG